MIHSCKGPIHIWDKQGLKLNAPCMFATWGSSSMVNYTACEKFSLVGFMITMPCHFLYNETIPFL